MVALGTFQWQEPEKILSDDDDITGIAAAAAAMQRYDTDGDVMRSVLPLSRLQMLWIQHLEEPKELNLYYKPTNNNINNNTNHANTKTTSYTWIMCRSAPQQPSGLPPGSPNYYSCILYDSSVKIRRTTTTTLSSNMDSILQTDDLPSHAYWFHYYKPLPKNQGIRLIPSSTTTSSPPPPHKIPTAIGWDCLGEIPVALSITLTSPPQKTVDLSSSTSSSLLQACLKRQMTGLILFWNFNNNNRYEDDGNKCDTNLMTLGRRPHLSDVVVTDITTISLDFANQNWTFCLQTMRVKSSHNNHKGGWVRIVPSTNCTIVWSNNNNNSDDHHSSSFPPSNDSIPTTVERLPSSVVTIRRHPLESSSSSSAYQFLYETVQHLQQRLHCSPMPFLHHNQQDVVPNNKKTVLMQSILLTGPPGVGKTHAVRTIRNEFGLQIVPAVWGMGPTQLLELLRPYFEQQQQPPPPPPGRITRLDSSTIRTMVFLDECDAFFPTNDLDMVRIMESTLCYCLDHLASHVILVAATNRPEALPNRVRMRFDRELHVGPPNRKERLQLLRSLLPSLSSSSSLSLSYTKQQQQQQQLLESVAEDCVGYVAADLAALVARAHLLQIKAVTATETPMNDFRSSKGEAVAEDMSEDTDESLIMLQYLRMAMKDIKASALREIIPPSKTLLWDDIIGNDQVKMLLVQAMEWPITKREAFRRLDLQPPRGILLYGPPGCAKTSLAKAAAHGRAFCAFSPADVYSTSYVGDAEAVIRNAFACARAAAPCILFFDELDAIVDNGALSSRGNHVEARVLSTFLNEMDGLETTMGNNDEMGNNNSSGVLVLAATNRPSVLDAALLRPGRFDRLIYVPPPDEDARRRILQHYTDGMFDEEAVHLSEHMTGAEIIGACREALIKCAKKSGRIDDGMTDFVRSSVKQCLREVKPLLGDLDVRESYKSI